MTHPFTLSTSITLSALALTGLLAGCGTTTTKQPVTTSRPARPHHRQRAMPSRHQRAVRDPRPQQRVRRRQRRPELQPHRVRLAKGVAGCRSANNSTGTTRRDANERWQHGARMTRQQQPLVPLREDDDGFCAVYWSRVFDYAGHNPVRVNPSYAFTVLDGKLQRYATVSLDVELSEGGRKKWKRLSSIAAADTYEQLFTMLGTELDAAAAVRNALDTNA